jgi:phospholipase C
LSRRSTLRGLGAGLASGLGLAGCGLGPDRCGGVTPRSTPDAPGSSHALLRHLDAFVVVMLENRSFDHLLGGLRIDPTYPGRHLLDGLTGEESNLSPEGGRVPVHRMPGSGAGSSNPRHDWRSVHRTFNEGRNDGFVLVNAGPHQDEVMGHLTREQVPFFHALADRFTVCDRWFSSFMGQTWPNRYYLHAGTAHGHRQNLPPIGIDGPPTVWDRLAERCLRGKNYGAGPVLWYTMGFPARAASGNDSMVPAPMEEFYRDARAGTLPELSIIDPEFKVSDGSPMHDLALAEAFVASIYRALAESPQWSRSLLVVTFDEHGGYFDHVPPPSTVDPRPDFRQLGFRVPAIVVGPTVRRGAVVSTPLEHVSVASTLRARFGIASLGARTDATADLASCIDPALIAAPLEAPRDLPRITLEARDALSRPYRIAGDDEVGTAIREGRVPAHLIDPRSGEERLRSWLRFAEELEAVRVVGR